MRLPGARQPLNWALGTKNNWGWGTYGLGSGPGTIWAPYKNSEGLATLSPMSKAQVGGVGTLMPLSASPWEPGGAGLQDSSLSSVPFSFVALLRGAAGWGAWAGISDPRDSLERGCGP